MMSDDKSILADIKSGKGLSPINIQSNTESTSSGLTSEHREQNSNGFRTNQFTLNNKKGGKRGRRMKEIYRLTLTHYIFDEDAGERIRLEEPICVEQVYEYGGSPIILNRMCDEIKHYILNKVYEEE